MTQTWDDLLFAHWPLPAAALDRFVPRGLALDTFGGRAWLGVVPFRIRELRLAGLPALPGGGAFNEINVRTYVRGPGGPGVVFLSLDADSVLAVLGARTLFHLPYFFADEAYRAAAGRVAFAVRRRQPGAPAARFAARYAPTGPVALAPPGSLEHWLTARYRLYTAAHGRIYCLEIRHPPWPLQPAAGRIHAQGMARAHGLDLPDTPPLLHYAARLQVYFWPLTQLH